MQISETRFRPTPPDDSALKLRVLRGEHGQFTVENGEGSLGGEFDRYYVNFGGYFGEHNPAVFAAAPELYEAVAKARSMLRRAANTAKTVALGRDLNRQADELDAALAKATAA